MIPISLKKLCKITNGILVNKNTLENNNIIINNISTNSKKIVSECLFIALIGKNFNAHDFINEAINKRASALLLEHRVKSKIPQIIVKNTTSALGKIASWIRKKCKANIIGITGSSGKTSVKEITASILKCYGNTLSTFKNLNNNIGVPLTLLNLDNSHKFAIIEMGANQPKEILYSTKLTNPDIVLINNIYHSHLDGFKSFLGVSKAKQEICSGLSEKGTAIFNSESHHWSKWKKNVLNKNVFWFSIKKKSIVC
ncbi:UDP-N-acetylmuramoyl-tripeptide--D-alanyl-D-alanine ligase [Buchnera aphidicola]|uniref:UDP-N-acetylmuramoyl-tripeptide--D-alanyl-D- alanine ligase n=1 Tax=Buchnera aphidicola TaxID=9 RepID=UPI000AB2DF82|nr:Mur ligase family protein [Buchnera aphidicola]